MITTKNEAPAEFMQRYQKVRDGEEKLDSIAKLKDFWMFAIEQGRSLPYQQRRVVAQLSLDVTGKSTFFHENYAIFRSAYIAWESYNLEGTNVDSEELHRLDDAGWRKIATAVSDIKDVQAV